jgi:hypothetical protein
VLLVKFLLSINLSVVFINFLLPLTTDLVLVVRILTNAYEVPDSIPAHYRHLCKSRLVLGCMLIKKSIEVSIFVRDGPTMTFAVLLRFNRQLASACELALFDFAYLSSTRAST